LGRIATFPCNNSVVKSWKKTNNEKEEKNKMLSRFYLEKHLGYIYNQYIQTTHQTYKNIRNKKRKKHPQSKPLWMS
jgi:hypothetical protein